MKTAKPLSAGLIIALIACYFFTPQKSFAENLTKITVKKIEFSAQNNLEITLSDTAQFKSFVLKNPDRLVVDVENAEFEKTDVKPSLPYFINNSRSGAQKNSQGEKSLRIVFDLKQQIGVEKSSFQKIKNQNFGKIIVELSGVEKNSLKKSAENSSAYTLKKIPQNSDVNYSLVTDKKPAIQKIVARKIPVIVIDAGHGGKDPGTIGDYARTKEKHITLAYAKELKKNLDNTKLYKVFLTRDEDFFIPLRKRVEKARKFNADLFISLHANSINDNHTSGLSIYTLSEKSSDKQAELLAQKENRSDIIAGVNFSGASQDTMKTLIDLSQRDSMNSSSRFANTAVRLVRKSKIKILQNSHRFAGFAVLTAPDVTSVLIELGYLSNKTEEAQLNNLIYKRKIVASLAGAIDEFFSNNLYKISTCDGRKC